MGSARPRWTRGLRLGTTLGLVAVSVACAGDLTVRAPQARAPLPPGPLAGVPSLAVEVPSAAGARASQKEVGEREPGLGLPGGPITLTETPGAVVRRVVAGELEAAGHRVVDAAAAEVVVALEVREFRVDAPRADRGWDVVAGLRVALRVSGPGAEGEPTEFVYTAERTAQSPVRPSLATTERVLAECLADLARLVSERKALAHAIQAHARRAGPASAS